jgi:hypothetical protein
VNPRTGAQADLVATGGRAVSDAVLAYKYPVRPFYANRRQLVFGGTADTDTAHATLHMPDAPMVFTLLTGNLRRGRPVDAFRAARFLAIYSRARVRKRPPSRDRAACSEPADAGASLADDGSVKIKVPSGTGIVPELQNDSGTPRHVLGEERQLNLVKRSRWASREVVQRRVRRMPWLRERARARHRSHRRRVDRRVAVAVGDRVSRRHRELITPSLRPCNAWLR